MMTRHEELIRSLSAMTSALRHIARSQDCLYADGTEADRPKNCDCPPCLARRVLDIGATWRYLGAHAERLKTNPREANIVAAWAALIDDRHLQQILDLPEGAIPSDRDWYVATSIVQWLATNVGQTVLGGAGYVYSKDAFDRAVREFARAPGAAYVVRAGQLDPRDAHITELEAALIESKRSSPHCTGQLVHDEFTSCPVHDTRKA